MRERNIIARERNNIIFHMTLQGLRKISYLRVELIKCIDPNEGEALKRGREGGGQAGGREGRVGQRGQEILPGGQN